jgi:RNA-directed DNA polymerase
MRGSRVDRADRRAVYTRYADDLTFSGGAELARRPDAFLRGVDRIVTDQGHRLNARKTRVRRAGVRQSVTGVVVNERTSPGRREVDRLHAVLHNAVVHGPASQNRAGHPDFRAHLLGRIGWVEQVHPARAVRLREEFDRITW